MRPAIKALRKAIAADNTTTRADERTRALESADKLEALYRHLRRSKQWGYHSSWPATAERAILDHLEPIADWADALPSTVAEPEAFAKLFNISELVEFAPVEPTKVGDVRIAGFEVWNTRPVSFSTAPGLKNRLAHLLISDTAGDTVDYGWHVHPVNEKGKKLNFILLFSPWLTGDDVLWQPFGKQKKKHKNPVTDTLKKKHGQNLHRALSDALGGIPVGDDYDAWAENFRTVDESAAFVAYSKGKDRPSKPLSVKKAAKKAGKREKSEV
ncbi:hypothetical protein [Corynebacterium sp.]|uniref:hypothetical protein n=1 Tax=Corynebacterium sp. TaxID=1720 RepID=UPI003735FBE0